jgi:hypothetical protein
LGDKPGVTIQAYTYFSMSQHLQQKYWRAWGFDILMGFFVGLIFHGIWQMFHYYRQQGRYARTVGLALGNFVILIVILLFLVVRMAPWLAQGIWINPAPMFIGLFIHSYVAAVTATGVGSGSLRSKWDLLLSWSLKVAVFWITVGMAVCILWTHH